MRTYEELNGAGGREIFYRAERFKAADVFKRGMPNVLIDDELCALHDLSLTGLSTIGRAGANHLRHVGQRVAVQFEICNIALFAGDGEIVRIEPHADGKKLAVRLHDRCLDIAHLVTAYQKAVIQADLGQWEDPDLFVPPAYRQLCADVLHLFRIYRSSLDHFEASHPDSDAARDLLAACEEQMLPRWRKLWARGNEIVAPIMGDRAALQATKRYTEAVLTPEFSLGAFARRCYDKPLGYPGDFECMNMVYDWRREGARLSDQLIHRVGLDIAECVAERMTTMRRTIAETVSRGGGRELRIASLGSGPAREVTDYLKIGALPGPVNFTLIDQDHAALSQAYERCLPEIMRLRGQASLTCLHGSFVQLMKAGELFGKLPEQDLIYSLGLIDYLSARRAKALVEVLYDRVAPGGSLIVANLRTSPVSLLWPAELITDWSLIYRDEQEMRALGADLPGAVLEITQDKTGGVFFLTARKPTVG
jgi:hypothetical protein